MSYIRNLKLYLFLFLFILKINLNSQINICNASLEPTFSIKKINSVSVPFQNKIPLPSFEKQLNKTRDIISLKGVWKEYRFDANHDMSLKKRSYEVIEYLANNPIPNIAYPVFNDSEGDWIEKQVPSVVENMNGTDPPETYSQGGVWFRKHFILTDSSTKKKYKLIFYSVNYVADVWINGHYLGYHEGGYTPFVFDISNELNLGKDNLIAIRVDNPPQESRCDIIPYNSKSHYCHYTGIIHDVFIEASNQISTIRADITPIDTLGNISIKYIENNTGDFDQNNINSEYTSDLIENENQFIVNKIIEIRAKNKSIYATNLSITISNPELWFPNKPNLYILKIILKDTKNNEIVDEYCSQFGIRKLEVNGSKVYLNNRPIFLTGINRAEDHPIYGRSLPLDIIYSDLLKIHDMNCNWIRTDHYPNHIYTYLITDRLGIAVTEEIPLMWFEKDSWTCQEKRNIHKQMFREMVFRDFNKPSIFMWSLCCEGVFLSKRKDFINWANEDKNKNYSDFRLLTQASGSSCPENQLNPESGTGLNDESQNLCDVAGYTTYHGEYYNKCEEPFKYQYYSRTNSFLKDFHNKFNKPLVTFEFGIYVGKNSEFQDTQKTEFIEKFKAFSQHSVFNTDNTFNCDGFVMAVTFWTSFDFWVGNDDKWQGYFGIYNKNRENPRPILEALKKAYEPYFRTGGIFYGDVPNCNN
jgi:beta-galactosidase